MVRKIHQLIVVLILAGLAAVPAAPTSASDHETFTSAQADEIERIVRDYLLKNPEVVLEALQVIEQRQKLAEQQRAREQLAARREDILNDPSSPVGWNLDGDVTIVEFFDYQCPYCRAVTPQLAQLKAEDKNIRFVYKEWPILGPVSRVAARAALASQEQGRYEQFHDMLMAYSGKLKDADIFKIAEKVGMDVEKLREDMKAPAIDEALARSRELARALGITGTPAFVIGDRLIPGAADLERLKAAVLTAREGT